MAVIRLDNVTRSFGEKDVLRGVSMSVEEGEIFGLLGPSGAGKTTLVNILTGQLAFGGRAEVFGEDCARIGSGIYRRVGAVLDNSGLYERLSCADNLRVFARIYGVPSRRIGEVLREVGLSDSEKTRAARLSKGMKQRLKLARAILHEPKLLFLDEPTSGLDPATAAEIHGLMRRLCENGATIFLTTHNMDEAYRVCDRTALLHHGEIIECGAPSEICRRHCPSDEFRMVTRDGASLSMANIPANADAFASLIREGRIKAIHSAEPDLGTVFLKLTGKELTQ